MWQPAGAARTWRGLACRPTACACVCSQLQRAPFVAVAAARVGALRVRRSARAVHLRGEEGDAAHRQRAADRRHAGGHHHLQCRRGEAARLGGRERVAACARRVRTRGAHARRDAAGLTLVPTHAACAQRYLYACLQQAPDMVAPAARAPLQCSPLGQRAEGGLPAARAEGRRPRRDRAHVRGLRDCRVAQPRHRPHARKDALRLQEGGLPPGHARRET